MCPWGIIAPFAGLISASFIMGWGYCQKHPLIAIISSSVILGIVVIVSMGL